MYDVKAIPTAEKAKAITTAAGMARIAHQLVTSPSGVTIAMKPVAYIKPLKSAQTISPSATSSVPREVANIDS